MKTTEQLLQPVTTPVVEKQKSPSVLKTAFLILIVAAIMVPIAGDALLSLRFSRQVSQLFSHAVKVAAPPFSHRQLAGLPDPVQRYFKHVLKEGQAPVQTMRMLQNGQFRTDLKKDWINLDGEEYLTADKPGFVWQGKAYMFTARDMYLADRGKLAVYVYHIFEVQQAEGKKSDEAELMRWATESVCSPTNLLPRKNLQWQPIDDKSARLNFKYNNISLFFKVTFNDKNEIVQMETDRYNIDGNKEKWIFKPGNYQVLGGMLIPTALESGWHLREGYSPYAILNITKIEYNKYRMF